MHKSRAFISSTFSRSEALENNITPYSMAIIPCANLLISSSFSLIKIHNAKSCGCEAVQPRNGDATLPC
ncbi:hypothetical protein QWZ13_18025 [Reinekea marina]|uniref:hypothetical protein n=1 Tax=Reinekea marina TaxID=1310421 RepID=UPI0025B2F94B|nr:hypothetical protein [Reinekea marina]MDN3650808.1 hypothetical protein [Reinekea marina]